MGRESLKAWDWHLKGDVDRPGCQMLSSAVAVEKPPAFEVPEVTCVVNA